MKFQVTRKTTVLGRAIKDAQTIEVDSLVMTDKTVSAAVAAQLTTRTDNAAGVITLPAGHGIPNGSKVDLYWGTTNLRTYCDAAVVGNALTLSNGAGDNLPTNLTNLVVAIVQVEPFALAGASMQVLAAGGNTARSSVRFHAADDAAQEYAAKIAAGRSLYWDAEAAVNGFTNPFDENIGTVRFSHANTTSAELMTIIAGVSN